MSGKFKMFRKLISLSVAAAVMAVSLLPAYGEEITGSTNLLKGTDGVAEGEGWVTFDPSDTSAWTVKTEGDEYYYITAYKGNATKLYIPGVVNNKHVNLKIDPDVGQVFKNTVTEIKTDYGVKIINPATVFSGSSIKKAEFNGTIFTTDTVDNGAIFNGHQSIVEASFYDCDFQYTISGSSYSSFHQMFFGCKELLTVSFILTSRLHFLSTARKCNP